MPCTEVELPAAMQAEKSPKIFIKTDCLVSGIRGSGKFLNNSWQTINDVTCVIFKNYTIVLRHCGNESLSQTNLIQTVDNVQPLIGKTITVSLWARVLEQSNDEKHPGGTLGIINACGYNGGNFYATKIFKNKDWRKISLTACLPEKERFKGLTICLRANTGIGENRKDAVIEICSPKLELGVFVTDL